MNSEGAICSNMIKIGYKVRNLVTMSLMINSHTEDGDLMQSILKDLTIFLQHEKIKATLVYYIILRIINQTSSID